MEPTTRITWRRKLVRISKEIRTIGGAAVILIGVLAWCYTLWPFPKETRAQIIELDERVDEHDVELSDLDENLQGFIMEQRVAMTRQEALVETERQNAELTRDVMLQLLRQMDGE